MKRLRSFIAQVRAEIRYWRNCAKSEAKMSGPGNWLDKRASFHFFRMSLGHFLGVHLCGRTCYIWRGWP